MTFRLNQCVARHRRRLVATVMAAALPCGPWVSLGASRQAAPDVVAVAPPQALVVSVASVAPSGLTDLPAALVPLTALAIEDQRSIIADQLQSLGRPPDVAHQLAGELTAEDLAVLLDNPKMMQKAGEIDVIIWALLVAGVVVALVIAADGSIVVNA